MLADFIPELLAESDEVVHRCCCAENVGFHVPEPHVIEEGQPSAFPNPVHRETVISSSVSLTRCQCSNQFGW